MSRKLEWNETFRSLNWREQLVVSLDLASFLAYMKNHDGDLGDRLANLNLTLGNLKILIARGYVKLRRNKSSPRHTGVVTQDGELFLANIRQEAERVLSLVDNGRLPNVGLDGLSKKEEAALLKALAEMISFFMLHDKNLVETVYANRVVESPPRSKKRALSRREWLERHAAK